MKKYSFCRHGDLIHLFACLLQVEDLTSAVDATRTTATPSSGGSERGKGKRGRKPGQKSSKPDMKNKLV